MNKSLLLQLSALLWLGSQAIGRHGDHMRAIQFKGVISYSDELLHPLLDIKNNRQAVFKGIAQ